MGDTADMPFKAEYAKSGRASCKKCKMSIPKDSLRMAIMVQSPMFDGKVPNWFHYKCFWTRTKVADSGHIHGYDGLRWEDQQKIKSQLGGDGGEGAAPSATNDFNVEYAKSGKSKCRGCESNIGKNEIRISRKDFESMKAKMYGPVDLWHHLDCFEENREELEFGTEMQPKIIKGFDKMKKDDQELIIAKLGKGEALKKRKSEAGGGPDAKKSKKETAEEKALKEQSKLIWKFRDNLQKEVSNEAMKVLLELNKQDIPSGESKLLDRVSDCLAFGAIEPCAECGGQFSYSGTGNGYKCTGNLTEWTKCQEFTQKPKRRAFKIPKEYHDVEFLKKYKYVARDRVFPPKAASYGDTPVSSASLDEAAPGPSGEGNQPLRGMKFVIAKTKKSKAEISKAISKLGGTVEKKVESSTAAVLGTKEEVDKMSKVIKDAKASDVQVVDEGFLEAVKKGGAMLLIQAHSVCSWGSDPVDRIGDIVDAPKPKKSAFASAREKKEEAMFTKSVPATQKLKLKGGAAVDPDSGLEEQAHVLQEKGEIYNAVLGMVDISKGTNSYYKVQILESDKSSTCWVFRSWGRVGTTIGGNKTEKMGSKNSAISHFKTLYGEKTGNAWEDRNSFMKIPNKFYPLDIDYGADDEDVKQLDLNAGSNSKLAKPVQELIKMIFDVESMKKAMLEFEIDMKKMPLGKLSKSQIEKAYTVLTELNGLIENEASKTKFLDASNRFYTLIPHDFGMKKPPMLDTADVIKKKTDMLDNLLEIEVAYKLLKSGDEGGKDPLDIHYEKLKTKIDVMDKKTTDYQTLLDYVKNTHAATHSYYDLEVLDIFTINRDGESKRFKPFKALGNRKLLWHGSRTTNYAGILSQGLRIAPPEAPVTGYMFGKGVYFADMVSKSANYCNANKTNPVANLLLCDVALGNMYELTNAKYITKLPKGMHSTKGCGKTNPDPAGSVKDADGVEIPMGKGMPSSIGSSSLLYNEYIVYDTAQINIKYMIQCKFHYKW